MSLWGESRAPNAICDRCRLRGPYHEMVQDPNTPGLWVHQSCADQYDPYRLPAREAENITLTHPRPDTKFDD